jgi:hypothetical protein
MRNSSRHECPACGADSVLLSLMNVRRRREFTCPQCAAKLEIIVPGWPYHLTTGTVSIVGTLLVPVFLLFFFAQQWLWVVALIALLVAMMLGSNVFLRRRSVVRRAPEPDPQAARPWYKD